jgi:osmoprotectant transport system substrate-binding protein
MTRSEMTRAEMTRNLHIRRRRIALALSGVLTSVLVAGCSMPTAGGYVPTGELAGPIEDVDDLDGATITVGSKNFSENVLLGKMAIILMQSAGATVTDLTNIPGSAAARQAMLNGQVQAMWEYTGTGWITYLAHEKPIPDEEEQYTAVRDEDLEKNKLVWTKPAPMNNTYGFAVTKKVADKYKITKLSQLNKVPVAERTFCVESELINRPDGMKGMLETYKVPLGTPQGVPQSNLKTFQTGAIYDATAKGACNFGEVFTTDGRIIALDLQVLEDDRSFFPKYNVSLVLTDDVDKKYPQIDELVAPVTEKLTNEVMLKLNAEIDVEGREPAEVAYEFLKKEGFVTDQ